MKNNMTTKKNHCLHYEDLVQSAGRLFVANAVPFCTTLVVGLLAHMFMFTNKLVNLDDIRNLFDKGTSITSGRWGLELLRWIFPDYSMPWFYGIISLLLLAVSVCMTIRLFDIRNRCLQVLYAGIIASFPTLTGTFSYMFTSAPYMLSTLLATACVVLCEKSGWKNIFPAALCAIFSMSIYQAFVGVVAAYFLLMLIKKVLAGQDDPKQIIRTGILRVVFLLVVMVIYYVSVQAVLFIAQTGFNDYANDHFSTESVNLVRRVYVALVNFLYFFTRSNWGLVNTPLSLLMHLTAFGVIAVILLGNLKKLGPVRTLLLGFLGVMLVLAINCMYLLVLEDTVHTLMLFGFTGIYVLMAIVFEALMQDRKLGRDLLLVALTMIMVNNIFIANKSYLRLSMEYERAYGTFNSIVTQIKQTEGFDENTTVAIIGNMDTDDRSYPWFADDNIAGVDGALVNVYSRDHFLRFYLDFDVNYATEEEIEQLRQRAEFEEMAIYPYYGSVQMIDHYIVVKLGEE